MTYPMSSVFLYRIWNGRPNPLSMLSLLYYLTCTVSAQERCLTVSAIVRFIYLCRLYARSISHLCRLRRRLWSSVNGRVFAY